MCGGTNIRLRAAVAVAAASSSRMAVVARLRDDQTACLPPLHAFPCPCPSGVSFPHSYREVTRVVVKVAILRGPQEVGRTDALQVHLQEVGRQRRRRGDEPNLSIVQQRVAGGGGASMVSTLTNESMWAGDGERGQRLRFTHTPPFSACKQTLAPLPKTHRIHF